MSNPNPPSVALVYDRANTPYGGAEQVLLALNQAFPQAPLFTSFSSVRHAPWLKQFPNTIASGWNKLPILRTKHRWLAAFQPLIFEGFDLNSFDIIISVTSAEAKGVLTKPGQLHLCYLLTPTRYLYQDRVHSLHSHWLLRLPVVNKLANILLDYLTWWDQAAILRPDVVIPISKRVAKRIGQHYLAVSPQAVIYPPVVKPLASQPTQGLTVNLSNYLLVVSRLVPYKKIELAINACGQLGRNLVIVGRGPSKSSLLRLAGRQTKATILFLDQVKPSKLANLYQHCQALIMPGTEDFGIVALEANSFGKPVLINTHSGAAELIVPGVHGLHLMHETSDAVIKAIRQLDQINFSSAKLKQNPLQYDTNNFVKKFSAAVDEAWQKITMDNL
ncbi:MAG TPA: glycosyltransferase [Patescibacteria group bacterium]|jgi:glycosyltransferase involved in cell wall biosynthesis